MQSHRRLGAATKKAPGVRARSRKSEGLASVIDPHCDSDGVSDQVLPRVRQGKPCYVLNTRRLSATMPFKAQPAADLLSRSSLVELLSPANARFGFRNQPRPTLKKWVPLGIVGDKPFNRAGEHPSF